MKTKITLERIMEVTVIVANKKGLFQVTLNDVSNALGIKTPSLYNHVSGIHDLYVHLSIYALKQYTETLTNSAIGLAKRDALEAIANASYEFSVNHPVLLNAIENPMLLDNELINQSKEHIVHFILKILKPYGFNPSKSIHITRSLRSYLYGFSMLSSQSLFQMNEDYHESFKLGLNALLDGFNL